MRIKDGTHSRRINLGSPPQYMNYLCRGLWLETHYRKVLTGSSLLMMQESSSFIFILLLRFRVYKVLMLNPHSINSASISSSEKRDFIFSPASWANIWFIFVSLLSFSDGKSKQITDSCVNMSLIDLSRHLKSSLLR